MSHIDQSVTHKALTECHTLIKVLHIKALTECHLLIIITPPTSFSQSRHSIDVT